MIRYISFSEALKLYSSIIKQTGGTNGLRDLSALQSAIAQPRMTYGGECLYNSIFDKAGALCYSLVQNHAFVDGNKRIGHAMMEVFLHINGYELNAPIEEQENLILNLASGLITREKLSKWILENAVSL